MAEQIEQKEEVAATETETTEQATGSNQNKQQTAFSQEDVNKIVAKEKAAWKRAQEKVSADHETIVEGLRKDVERRDELISKQVDLLVKDLGLDEDTMELLNGLDVLAKYEWIAKKVEKTGKTEIPRTPQRQGKEQAAQPFARTNQI